MQSCAVYRILVRCVGTKTAPSLCALEPLAECCLPYIFHTSVCAPLLLLQWTDPRELHGMGQYARDAYFMFCRGQWRALRPQDKDLK